MSTITIELDDQRMQTLQEWAKDSGVSLEDLARELLEGQAIEAEWAKAHPLTAEEKASIRRGLEQLNRGEGIPHEQVMAELKAKFG